MPTKPFTLAFDKTSARRVDDNGFLHVKGCNISKATVNPYLGAEIPTWQQLGLDPGKTYNLLRPADELEKAAPTCNMIPLMDAHIEVSAFDLENPDIARHRVGSTGQLGRFEAPYLVNDLVVTNASAIEGVNSKEQCELSCAYRYDVVMTPGEYEGTKYDGYMTNIRFNHVALVVEGRAGPDVVVADSNGVKEARMVKVERIKQALQPGPWARIRATMASDVVAKQPGHKNSKGEAAPYVVNSERVGKVISSAKTKTKAVSNLRNIEGHKADDCLGSVTRDANPEGINQYTAAAGTAKSASISARKSGTYSDHMKAAKAHVDAAKAALKNGDPKASQMHLRISQQHMRDFSKAHDQSGCSAKDIAQREEVSPKAGATKYGKVSFADPKNKKYPLDTPAHVRAAASYFGMAKNRSMYSKEDQDTIQSRIASAEKKFNVGAANRAKSK